MGTFITINTYIKKQERSQINNQQSNFTPDKEKNKLNPKLARRKKIMKIRFSEINKIENRKIREAFLVAQW